MKECEEVGYGCDIHHDCETFIQRTFCAEHSIHNSKQCTVCVAQNTTHKPAGLSTIKTTKLQHAWNYLFKLCGGLQHSTTANIQ